MQILLRKAACFKKTTIPFDSTLTLFPSLNLTGISGVEPPLTTPSASMFHFRRDCGSRMHVTPVTPAILVLCAPGKCLNASTVGLVSKSTSSGWCAATPGGTCARSPANQSFPRPFHSYGRCRPHLEAICPFPPSRTNSDMVRICISLPPLNSRPKASSTY